MMTDSSTAVAPRLVLTRTFDVPAQRLYDAWTDPHALTQFLGPSPNRVTDVTVDARPGGTYSLVMIVESGERWRVRGTYRDVEPPHRLSMTWIWEEDDPTKEVHTLLTLEFIERGSKTELVLTHENFGSTESRDGHQKGWTQILDQLETYAR